MINRGGYSYVLTHSTYSQTRTHTREPLSLSEPLAQLQHRYHKETLTKDHECGSAKASAKSLSFQHRHRDSDSSCSWLVSCDYQRAVPATLSAGWSITLLKVGVSLPSASHTTLPQGHAPTVVVQYRPPQHFVNLLAGRERVEFGCAVTLYSPCVSIAPPLCKLAAAKRAEAERQYTDWLLSRLLLLSSRPFFYPY